MKQLVLGFFVFAFVFNTISLSAYASSCPKEVEAVQARGESGMPCHEQGLTGPNASHKPAKVGHCKGICFCQHASVGQNIVPLRLLEPLSGPVAVKSLIPSTGERDFASVVSFPPERPPKNLS